MCVGRAPRCAPLTLFSLALPAQGTGRLGLLRGLLWAGLSPVPLLPTCQTQGFVCVCGGGMSCYSWSFHMRGAE